MPAGPSDNRGTLYPAYCFALSPTYNAWVKLTAADVHGLRTERGYEGQNIYFHLNHPIRFARLVAPIVAFTQVGATASGSNKYVILTLDDGSGTTIDVKITKLDDETAASAECPSNSSVSNLQIYDKHGLFELLIDGSPIDIGTVLLVKCTIEVWRGAKQLVLQRVRIVKSTEEEAVAWSETADFRTAVLNRPWVVEEGELKRLEQKARNEAELDRKKERKRSQAEEVVREKRKAHEEKVENRRKKLEERYNAGALV